MSHETIQPIPEEEIQAMMDEDASWLDEYDQPDSASLPTTSGEQHDKEAETFFQDVEASHFERQALIELFGDKQTQVFMAHYLVRDTFEDMKAEGLPDAEDYRKFVGALDAFLPLTKGELDERIKLEKEMEDAVGRLRETAPEILEGRLPKQQEEALGSGRYTLGFNQTATFSLADSAALIQEHKGLPLYEYAPGGRFNFADTHTDPDIIKPLAMTGYAGTLKVQRFVIAAPMDNFSGKAEELGRLEVDAAYRNGELPSDFTDFSEENNPVSSKYIAGVITETGEYVPNENFAKGTEFKLKGVREDAIRQAISARLLDMYDDDL